MRSSKKFNPALFADGLAVALQSKHQNLIEDDSATPQEDLLEEALRTLPGAHSIYTSQLNSIGLCFLHSPEPSGDHADSP